MKRNNARIADGYEAQKLELALYILAHPERPMLNHDWARVYIEWRKRNGMPVTLPEPEEDAPVATEEETGQGRLF